MAKRPSRVTDEEKKRMYELYLEIGTYAGVAREVGRAATTVKRYVLELQEKESNEGAEIDAVLHFVAEPKSIEDVGKEFQAFLSNHALSDMVAMTEEEKIDYEFMRGLLL